MSEERRLRVVRDAGGHPHLHVVGGPERPPVTPETRAAEPAPQAPDPRTPFERLAPPYGPVA